MRRRYFSPHGRLPPCRRHPMTAAKEPLSAMQFDIRTLLVAVALATAFCGAARLLLWRMQPSIPGLGRWAAAGGLGALALMLIVLRGVVPELLSLSLAQLLMAVGFVLSWDGFRRFIGHGPLSPRLLALLAVAALVPVVIADLQHSLLLRSWSNSLLLALVSALIARELTSTAARGRPAMRATGWVYALNAAFFLASATAAMQPGDGGGPWNPDGLAALRLLWWLCMTVAVTLGMVLMTGERLKEDLDRHANQDPLTGALNRRAFALIADKEVARAQRSGDPLSVLMIDLDRFKQINDLLGHSGGDDILRRFAGTASRGLRGGDVLCRFGGEEFVALLPVTAAAGALGVAERLRLLYADEAAAVVQGGAALPFPITVSVGVSELRPGEDIEEVIRRADDALYRAKAAGRNRCAVAEEEMGGAAGSRAAV